MDKIISDWFSRLGKKGGAARALKLSPERRKEIAVNAGKHSWDKRKQKNPR